MVEQQRLKLGEAYTPDNADPLPRGEYVSAVEGDMNGAELKAETSINAEVKVDEEAIATGAATTDKDAVTGEAVENLEEVSNDEETEKGEELDNDGPTPLGLETQNIVTVSPSTQNASSTAEETWYIASEHPDLEELSSTSTDVATSDLESTVKPNYF